MSIISLTIAQNNVVSNCNLFAIHNTLAYLVDIEYTGAVPTTVYCEVYSDDVLLNKYSCVPFKDLSTRVRQYIFIADSVLRHYMSDFEDIPQTGNTIMLLANISKQFTLKFTTPNSKQTESVNIVCFHGVNQLGESAADVEIFMNENKTYFAEEGGICYLYVYSNDPDLDVDFNNIILINVIACDSDEEDFVDNDDEPLIITVAE